jgi:glyoxylase-like metal-dependent hydrolase (beta-lactamase superfamily II)
MSNPWRACVPSVVPTGALRQCGITLVILATLMMIGGDAPFQAAAAQRGASALRLYVLDCGTLINNNPEAYNLTRQEVKNTNMSVACYLVVHPRGVLLFDTGLPDSTLGRPFNEAPLTAQPDPPSTAYFMLVTRTLKSQLAAIGFAPDKINYLALSHFHGDHVGNANDYAASVWLVQKTEYDAMFGPNVAPGSGNPSYRLLKNSKTQILQGDHDVFGDGAVVLKSTPGHTPGHQSLYVRLAKSGGIVLSGDLYHYPEERTLGRMPEREKTTGTAASRASLEAFMKEVKAQLWIEHDITANSKQKKSPEYYD